jgi:hypothetical protein
VWANSCTGGRKGSPLTALVVGNLKMHLTFGYALAVIHLKYGKNLWRTWRPGCLLFPLTPIFKRLFYII